MSETGKSQLEGWAKVELRGHQVLVGKVMETRIAGWNFIRVDVPAIGKHPGYSDYLTARSIYRISPVSEEDARALLPPVQRNEMPAIAEKVRPRDNGHEAGCLCEECDPTH